MYTQTERTSFKGKSPLIEGTFPHSLADQGITLYSSVFGGAYLIQQSIGGRWIDKGFPLGLGIYIYGLIQFSPLLSNIPSCLHTVRLTYSLVNVNTMSGPPAGVHLSPAQIAAFKEAGVRNTFIADLGAGFGPFIMGYVSSLFHHTPPCRSLTGILHLPKIHD